jgi:hypothetical protein
MCDRYFEFYVNNCNKQGEIYGMIIMYSMIDSFVENNVIVKSLDSKHGHGFRQKFLQVNLVCKSYIKFIQSSTEWTGYSWI